jgi:hypothetical protein
MSYRCVSMIVASFVLMGALSACSSPDRAVQTPGRPTTSAKAGFGERTVPSASPADVVEVSEAFFRTPSRNIVCVLTKDNARCDIAKKSWRPTPKPADCDLDWGFGLYVDKTGKAGFTCTGDSLLGASKQTLEYGHALRAGDLVCDSQSAAISCSNEASGHGFTLSVQKYVFF